MMKKLIGIFCVFLSTSVLADQYGGFGVGVAEACRSLYKPSFSGGDCIHRDIDFHAMFGANLSDYFALETSADFAFDAGNIVDAALEAILSESSNGTINYNNSQSNYYQTTGRWSVFNVGVHALGKLPITRDFILFGGPSLGASYTEVDTGVKYFDNAQQNYRDTTQGFGTNYGFALGVDVQTSNDSAIRLQWQNWRSVDNNAASGGHFNTNTLTISFRNNF